MDLHDYLLEEFLVCINLKLRSHNLYLRRIDIFTSLFCDDVAGNWARFKLLNEGCYGGNVYVLVELTYAIAEDCLLLETKGDCIIFTPNCDCYRPAERDVGFRVLLDLDINLKCLHKLTCKRKGHCRSVHRCC
jgi:hypothetical protein